MSKHIHCPQCHRKLGEYTEGGKKVQVCHGGRCTWFEVSGATSCQCGCTVRIEVPRDLRGEKVLK
jgi:hypothetical protein